MISPSRYNGNCYLERMYVNSFYISMLVMQSYDVEQENCKVKDEWHNVEYESFLSPLLSVIEFDDVDHILEVVLDCLQEKSHELNINTCVWLPQSQWSHRFHSSSRQQSGTVRRRQRQSRSLWLSGSRRAQVGGGGPWRPLTLDWSSSHNACTLTNGWPRSRKALLGRGTCRHRRLSEGLGSRAGSGRSSSKICPSDTNTSYNRIVLPWTQLNGCCRKRSRSWSLPCWTVQPQRSWRILVGWSFGRSDRPQYWKRSLLASTRHALSSRRRSLRIAVSRTGMS